MIRIINEVRARVYRESGVDVNMRIGIHSGNIISGILGTNKWQYDVWSRDVVIANKMEQTGKPGKVHVTQQTLDLVNANDYNCVPVDRLDDEVLRKYGIRSYLITPSLPETPIPNITQVRVPQWRRKIINCILISRLSDSSCLLSLWSHRFLLDPKCVTDTDV